MFSIRMICVGCALGFAVPGLAIADVADVPQVSHFSGKPVPRFESLRYRTVNGRAGPSLDYPIRWQYQRAGLPVMILKETESWRFVRDPGGDEVWMHARMLSEDQTAVAVRETLVRSNAAANASALARLGQGAQVDVLDVQADWVRIVAGEHRGWVPLDSLWGIAAPR